MAASVRIRVGHPFVPVPRTLIKDHAVSDGAKVLYMVLWDLSDWNTREVNLTQAQIAESHGCGLRTVQGYLGELVSTGYVKSDYNRKTHLQTYILSALGPTQDLASTPADSCVDPTQDPAPQSLNTDSTTQTKNTAPPPAVSPTARAKPDTARANRFIVQFNGWYQEHYGRVPAAVTGRGVFAVASRLASVDRDAMKVEALKGVPAEDILLKTAAAAAKAGQPWFVKNDPLTLRVLVTRWDELWDFLLQKGQQTGRIAHGNGANVRLMGGRTPEEVASDLRRGVPGKLQGPGAVADPGGRGGGLDGATAGHEGGGAR